MERNWIWFPRPELGVVQSVQDIENRSLILFVHGFQGDCLDTWGDLPNLLLTDTFFNNSDFCFIGYHATVSDITSLGGYLSQILEKAAKGEAPFPRQYRSFMLVAHSLGGAGLRSALVSIHRNKSAVFKQIQACLLCAPAIFGSQLTTGNWRFRLFFQAVSLLRPVLNDLSDLNNSLEVLRTMYDKIKGKKPQTDIRWALYERVVKNPPPEFSPTFPDTQSFEPYSHCDIVKASDTNHPVYQAIRRLACVLHPPKRIKAIAGTKLPQPSPGL